MTGHLIYKQEVVSPSGTTRVLRILRDSDGGLCLDLYRTADPRLSIAGVTYPLGGEAGVMEIVDALLKATGREYKVVEVPGDLQFRMDQKYDLDYTRVTASNSAGEDLQSAVVATGSQKLREQAALMLALATQIETLEQEIQSDRNKAAQRLGWDAYHLLSRERQSVINNILSEERPEDACPE